MLMKCRWTAPVRASGLRREVLDSRRAPMSAIGRTQDIKHRRNIIAAFCSRISGDDIVPKKGVVSGALRVKAPLLVICFSFWYRAPNPEESHAIWRMSKKKELTWKRTRLQEQNIFIKGLEGKKNTLSFLSKNILPATLYRTKRLSSVWRAYSNGVIPVVRSFPHFPAFRVWKGAGTKASCDETCRNECITGL